MGEFVYARDSMRRKFQKINKVGVKMVRSRDFLFLFFFLSFFCYMEGLRIFYLLKNFSLFINVLNSLFLFVRIHNDSLYIEWLRTTKIISIAVTRIFSRISFLIDTCYINSYYELTIIS